MFSQLSVSPVYITTACKKAGTLGDSSTKSFKKRLTCTNEESPTILPTLEHHFTHLEISAVTTQIYLKLVGAKCMTY